MLRENVSPESFLEKLGEIMPIRPSVVIKHLLSIELSEVNLINTQG